MHHVRKVFVHYSQWMTQHQGSLQLGLKKSISTPSNLSVSTNDKTFTTHLSQNPLPASLTKVSEDFGLGADTLLKAIDSVPSLSKTAISHWEQYFTNMSRNGFDPKFSLSLLSTNPDLLKMKPCDLSESLQHWRNCQFGEDSLKTLLAMCPILLSVQIKEISLRIPKLKYLSSTKRNIVNLLGSCPSVMFENWKRVESKIDYLSKTMKVENVQIVKSRALACSLDDIKLRHVFLERCGKYVAPSAKVDPMEPSKNPPLYMITDSEDKYFATKVAELSLEEFEVFTEMFAEEDSDSDDDDDDDDLTDTDSD